MNMAKKGEKISDAIMNKLTGRNIETFMMSLEEMVALVDEHFIQPAATSEDYAAIWKTVKGGIFLNKRLASKDAKHEIYVHTSLLNAKNSNYIWIRDIEQDKYYKYRPWLFGLHKFKKAVKAKISEAQTKEKA
jgi:hypothetical protein